MATENTNKTGSNSESVKNNSTENLLKLYELQLKSLIARRTTYWTIIISIWTAIVVGTGFLYANITMPLWIILVIYLILLPIFGFWLFQIWFADRCDHEWWYYYRDIVEFKVGIRKEDIQNIEDIEIPKITADIKLCNRLRKYFKKFITDGYVISVLLITAILMTISILLFNYN